MRVREKKRQEEKYGCKKLEASFGPSSGQNASRAWIRLSSEIKSRHWTDNFNILNFRQLHHYLSAMIIAKTLKNNKLTQRLKKIKGFTHL